MMTDFLSRSVADANMWERESTSFDHGNAIKFSRIH